MNEIAIIRESILKATFGDEHASGSHARASALWALGLLERRLATTPDQEAT